MPARKETGHPEMFSLAPIARQVQAAREANGNGRITARVPQKLCDAGLFAPAEPDQPSFFT